MKKTLLLFAASLASATLLQAQTPPGKPTLCCTNAPERIAFTGGNAPDLDATTTPSTADVAVVHALTKVERTISGFRFTATIANDNGNNCTPKDQTRAIIQLPVDVKVTNVKVTTADGSMATWVQCGATIEASLGQLCPADNRIGKPSTITVETESSKYTGSACLPAFGVFAFSTMPDHVPGNNNWWWREHCKDGTTSSPVEQPKPTKGYQP